MSRQPTFVQELSSVFRTLPFSSREEAEVVFSGKPGRDGTNTQLAAWLQKSSGALSENIQVEDTDHVSDMGVDIEVRGLRSKARIAIQVKSDNDLKSGLLGELKRQYADARSTGNLALFVVVFACSSSKYQKYKATLNHSLTQFTDWVVVVPEKAATLFARIHSPLSREEVVSTVEKRDWTSFLEGTKPSRSGEFLNHWSGLLPAERFVPPGSYSQILNSIQEEPLTVLVGPPLAGKTFIGVHELFRHYKAGKPVRWIDGTLGGLSDSPIVLPNQTQGLRDHVRYIAASLGINPPSIPVAPTEFVATTLAPDTLVLIEDPFGFTDADFERSLASYDFFALHQCVEALTKHEYPGCSVLVTTRQGLFERWALELAQRSVAIPRMRLIGLSSQSYGLDFMRRTGMRMESLARKLLKARFEELGQLDIEAAVKILEHASTPYEIEHAVKHLPKNASLSDVGSARERLGKDHFQDIERLCNAETDYQVVFLLLLVALTDSGHRGRLKESFLTILRELDCDSDAEATYKECLNRYWGVTSVSYDEENNVRSIRPLHPSVTEAIVTKVSKATTVLNRVSAVVANLPLWMNMEKEQNSLTYYLIDHRTWIDEDALVALISSFKPKPKVVAFRDPASKLFGEWRSLPKRAREAFLASAQTQDTESLVGYCSLLQYHMEFPPDDAWRLYRPILRDLPAPTSLLRYGAYTYLINKSRVLPEDIKRSIEHHIDTNLVRFAYVLGPGSIRAWDRVPTNWQDALLSERLLAYPKVQEQMLYWLPYESGLPSELETHLTGLMSSIDYSLRIVGAEIACYLSSNNGLPIHLQKALEKLVCETESPTFGLELVRESSSIDKCKGNLLTCIIERLSSDQLALLASYLLDRKETPDEFWSQLPSIKLRASNLLYAVLELYRLGKHPDTPLITEEENKRHANQDQLQAVYIWNAVLQAAEGKGGIKASGLTGALKKIKGASLFASVYILEHQARFIDEDVIKSAREVIDADDADIREIREWAQERAEKDHDGQGRGIPAFPWSWFIDLPSSPPSTALRAISINLDEHE